MEIIYTALIGAGLGFILLMAFLLHDEICQKKAKKLLEKEKPTVQTITRNNAKSKTTTKTYDAKKTYAKIHEKDTPKSVIISTASAVIACSLITIGSFVFQLIFSGLHW